MSRIADSRPDYPFEYDFDPVTDCFCCHKEIPVGSMDSFCSPECDAQYIKQQNDDADAYAASLEADKKLAAQYEILRYSYDRQDNGKYDF